MMIVPDAYRGTMPRTNWILQRVKTQFEALFATIEAGTTRLKISETSPAGTAFPGFRDKILKAIKRLLTVVPGRTLIKNITDGGFDVTIKPDPGARATAGSTASTLPGARARGASSTILMDPNGSNRTQRVLDRDGNEISFPFFINLGHELIHAMHNQQGTEQSNVAPSVPEYTNAEEEATINGPGVSENSLRRSYGLTQRHGHHGSTGAHSTSTVSGGATGG